MRIRFGKTSNNHSTLKWCLTHFYFNYKSQIVNSVYTIFNSALQDRNYMRRKSDTLYRNWWVICARIRAQMIVKKFQLHKNLCYFHSKDSFHNLNYFLFSSKIVSLECVLGWKLQYIFYGILPFFPVVVVVVVAAVSLHSTIL